MKTIVVETSSRSAVLLAENGAFYKTKNRGYRIGQQVTHEPRRKHPFRQSLIAAAILLFLIGGTGTAAARLPFSYVSLDINPSIEYTLNWFDQVISLKAVNSDASVIAQTLTEEGALHKPIEKVIAMTLDCLEKTQYVAADEQNDVVLGVASYGLKDTATLAHSLAGSTDSLKAWQVTTIQTDSAKVEQARQFQTTAGKLALVEEVEASESSQDTFSMEEWLNKPVREILSHRGKPDQPGKNPMNSQENPTANTPDGQASSQAEPTPAVKREHAPKATPQKTENDTSATPPPLPQATSAPQASPQDTVPPKEQHGASQDGDSPGKDEHQRPPETKTTPDKTHQPKEDNGPGNKPKGS